ncbi:uncharacterized protein LOC117316947 [Pecten maximus]|uniref:uncharacterized protein LOC117316947 n=1 Tax=Pecten maximus TaxID=6579 RepID=UPI00145816EE|nr:uncharacterized protein LOC117316947 [Pecten maximus]
MKIILYLFYWNPPLVYQMIYVAMLAYLPGTGATNMESTNTSHNHVDLDVLQRSVRLFVSGSRRQTVTRFEIVKLLLAAGVPGKEIVSVFRLEAPNAWFVTLNSEDLVDDVVGKGPMRQPHFTLSPERCDQRRLSLRVQWLPTWISDDAIAAYFHQLYGKVINISRETTTVGTVLLETGTREITMVIREGDQDRIPYRARLFGKVALIMVPGRPPICLRCQQVGHVRSQCPGRSEPTTRVSYAKAAQSSESLTEQSTPASPEVAAASPSAGGSGPVSSPPVPESGPTASPSPGGSGADVSIKRPIREIDEDGFQVSKKGRHTPRSPMILSNGDIMPGQYTPEEDSDMEDDADQSGDNLVIDEDSSGVV